MCWAMHDGLEKGLRYWNERETAYCVSQRAILRDTNYMLLEVINGWNFPQGADYLGDMEELVQVNLDSFQP